MFFFFSFLGIVLCKATDSTTYKYTVSIFGTMKNLLWYLIAGTKGGESRAKMINLLNKNPCNANKIAQMLKLDYKTIRHHLDVLEKNNILTPINKGGYGSVYFLSESMKSSYKDFEEIWAGFGKK